MRSPSHGSFAVRSIFPSSRAAVFSRDRRSRVAAVALPPDINPRARLLALLAALAQRCPETLAVVVAPVVVGSALFYRGARAAAAHQS